MISIDEIKRLIDRENIRVISFDMFDTLVVRECISSKNAIALLAQIIEKQYGVSVKEHRISAEKELNIPFATITMIWNHIANRMNLPKELASTFSNMEFELEKTLISPRRIGKMLYDYAVSKQKKIVVTSDMHFSSEQLRMLLEKCGYISIDNIYVSCENEAVKRTGKLYDVVIEQAKYAPEQILHIGDNKRSDYLAAKSKKLVACYIPKNIDILNEKYEVKQLICKNNVSVYESLIYGFAINSLCNQLIDKDNVTELETFTYLVIFPMLMHATLKLLNQKDIQENKKYKELFFVSRDGYLINKAYDILSVNFKKRLPSRYLLTSRIACMTIMKKNFHDKINNLPIDKKCTLQDFIVTSVIDKELRNYIIDKLSQSELKMIVTDNIERSIEIINQYSQALGEFHERARKAAFSYYSNIFSKHKNILLVDCGFSGTIASYMKQIFENKKMFDKYFLWTNEKNKINDKKNNSITYTAFEQKKGHGVAPIAESFFSELKGSCLGFLCDKEKKTIPIYEEVWYPSAMKSDILFVQNTALKLTTRFRDNLNFLFDKLSYESMPLVMEFVEFFTTERKTETAKMLGNIFLKESYESNIGLKSLGDMVLKRNAKIKET